jgi:hypothetical protein
MTKIVYNTTFGGFGLSLEAMQDYVLAKGNDWRVAGANDYHSHSWLEQRVETGCTTDWRYVSCGDLDRSDPALVEVVERLADTNPDLAIRELPVGTRYVIREYDGAEDVVTVDEFDWRVA